MRAPSQISKNYGSLTGLSYHAYLIVGWEDTPSGTKWLLKDSWPGASGFIYSLPGPDIVAKINANTCTMYQVSGIVKNGTPSMGTCVNFNPSDQCPPVAPVVTSLIADEPTLTQNQWHTLYAATSCNTPVSEGNSPFPVPKATLLSIRVVPLKRALNPLFPEQ